MSPGRPDENQLERADRNWEELLAELRVAQAGVVLLFSVLLTVPFSARFDGVTDVEKGVYLAALMLSASTTVVLIAPVALHRQLFATGHKPELVRLGDRLTRAGLLLLALTLSAVLLLVIDVVGNRGAAIAVTATFLLATISLWFLLPRRTSNN